jgi:hypothetical protein
MLSHVFGGLSVRRFRDFGVELLDFMFGMQLAEDMMQARRVAPSVWIADARARVDRG